MNLVADFPTPRAAAYAVQEVAHASGFPRLTALPYNPLQPDSTTWWLSPSTDNPAYKFGKIIFTSKDAAPADLLIGLYIEKGIGQTAAGPYSETARGRRCIMDDTWTWNDFLPALQSGLFDQLFTQVEAEARRPVVVTVDGAHVPIPTAGELDPHSHRRDLVRFWFSNGLLRFLEPPTLEAGVLRGLGTPQRLADLAAAIRRIGDLEWVWIDFSAGFLFSRLHAQPGPNLEIWDADLIWRRACAPWAEWLR